MKKHARPAVILILLLLSILGALAAVRQIARGELETRLEQIRETAFFQTKIMSEQANRLFNEYYLVLRLYRELCEAGIADPYDPRIVETFIGGNITLARNLRTILLFDPRGRLRYPEAPEEELTDALLKNNAFLNHRNKRTVFGSGAVREKPGSPPLLFMSMGLETSNSRYAGNLVLVLSSLPIRELFHELAAPLEFAAVFDEGGDILFRMETEGNAGEPQGGDSIFGHPAFRGSGEVLSARGGTERYEPNRIIAGHRLHDFPFGVAAIYDTSAVLEGWRRWKNRITLTVFSFAGLLWLLLSLSWLFVRRQKRARKAVEAAREETELYRLLQSLGERTRDAASPSAILAICLEGIFRYLGGEGYCYFTGRTEKYGLKPEEGESGPPDFLYRGRIREDMKSFSGWNLPYSAEDPAVSFFRGYAPPEARYLLPFKLDDSREIVGICLFHSPRPFERDFAGLGILPRFSEFILRLLAERKARNDMEASIREKETLLKEIHHRVKNNLQVVSSLLDLQGTESRNPAVLEGFQKAYNRIRAIALVHEELYRSDSFAKISLRRYAESVIGSIEKLHALPERKIRLLNRIDPNTAIDLTSAVPCGLIINELLTNSLKHAFPAGRGGTVVIETSMEPPDKLRLVIKDDGVGIPEGKTGEGLGMQLVEVLVRQIAGTLELDTSRGAAYTIRFPLSPQ